jgi:peptidoglycan hydrolase CwlO-like protein
MDINVRLYFSSEALAATNAALHTILRKLNDMSKEMDALVAQVAANKTVTESAVTLLQGLKAQLDAAIASGDPAALQALSDSLAAQDTALADAVTANTPAPTP